MLLGPKGNPINSGMYARPKASPLIGEIAAPWAGIERMPTIFPLENSLQFNTSRLTLNDYRMMKDHYQINSSLTVLTFMLHQIEWRIECDNIKIAKHCEENMREIWTRLVRGLSQAFWSGYSPCALQWENDIVGRKIRLTKVKDLRPEDSRVHWKEVKAKASNRVNISTGEVIQSVSTRAATPKVKIFDGIDQAGYPTIPTDNSLWYPLLMENGDYYGRKLLKAAFQPWFFSSLIHYYSNRYFERFGEPAIIGRAPFDEKIDVNGANIQGNVLMSGLLGMVRNGASITLPNTRAMNGLDGVNNYEYTMEYLESQMRGADFERYLTRLDQEMSLALFTPLLMMNTGDSGGSFNLGIVHTQMYANMVSAIAGDMQEYINKYVLAPMAKFNFGENAKLPRWEFRKPGKTKEETLRTIILALLNNGNAGMGVKINLEEVGQELGMSLEETGELLNPPNPAPNQQNPDGQNPDWKPDQRVTRPKRTPTGKGTEKPSPSTKAASKQLADQIANRIAGQFVRQIKDGVQEPSFNMGHERQLMEFMSEIDTLNFRDDLLDWAEEYYSIELNDEAPLESRIRKTLETGVEAQLCNA